MVDPVLTGQTLQQTLCHYLQISLTFSSVLPFIISLNRRRHLRWPSEKRKCLDYYMQPTFTKSTKKLGSFLCTVQEIAFIKNAYFFLVQILSYTITSVNSLFFQEISNYSSGYVPFIARSEILQ